jgi:transposase
MDERLRFVARLLDGDPMAEVCRAFGIARKTGYKIFDRYKEHGLEALSDRSRRPVRYANQLPAAIESLIVTAKRDKPHWGARKIREILVRRLDGDIRVPAKSTIHAVLHRHGPVRCKSRYSTCRTVSDDGAKTASFSVPRPGAPPSSPAPPAPRYAAAGLDRGARPRVPHWCR